MRRFLLLLTLTFTATICFAGSAQANALDENNSGYAFLYNSWNSARPSYVIRTQNGTSTSTDARLNALALQVHVRASVDGHPAIMVNPERINTLVDLLTKYPTFIDGEYTPYNNEQKSMAHTPGFTSSAGNAPGFQHVAVDPVIAMGLAMAYHYRDQIGLTPENAEKARYAVLRVAAHQIFAPNQIRTGQMAWTADMLWAKYLIDGDQNAFVQSYRQALTYQTSIMPKLIGKYGSYHYNIHQSISLSHSIVNKMDAPEYSFISFQGLAYLQIARNMGMSISAKESALYHNWANRLVWGEYGNNGYLNWDTGQGQHRRHITQYWAWATLGLQRIASQMHGFLSPSAEKRAIGLCNRAQNFFAYQVQKNNGILPSVMYGVWNDFIGTTTDSSLGNVRLLLALQNCPDGESLASARSFDPENHRLAVTTTRYTTSITPYNRDTISGFLPNKLLDARGAAIGGLGSKRSGFNFVAKGFQLNDTYARHYDWWMRATPGSGPLTASRSTFTAKAAIGGGKQKQQAMIHGRFTRDSIIFRADMLKPIKGYWRIPVPAGQVKLVRNNGRTILRMDPTGGRSWQVTFPGNLPGRLVQVRKDRLDPTIRRVAQIRVDSKKLQMTIHVD